jgi:hypothetical protein
MYLGTASKTQMFTASGNDQGKEEKQEKDKKNLSLFVFFFLFICAVGVDCGMNE